jgi:hypothetical protein
MVVQSKTDEVSYGYECISVYVFKCIYVYELKTKQIIKPGQY